MDTTDDSLLILSNIYLRPYQVYSVNYPSLRNQNILRKVLVGEVLYWAEKLKSGWMEKQSRGVLPLRLTEDGKESPSETGDVQSTIKRHLSVDWIIWRPSLTTIDVNVIMNRILHCYISEKKEEFHPGELDVRGEDGEDEELLALPRCVSKKVISRI